MNSARALLACRHNVSYYGPFDYSRLDSLIPRRKDGTFGAIRCDRCRRKRRVVSAYWSLGASNR